MSRHGFQAFVLMICVFGSVGCVQTIKKSTVDPSPDLNEEPTSVLDNKIRKYAKLAREFPEEPKYRERMARLYWEKRDHQNALKQLDEARELDPGNPKYDFIEGRIHLGISNHAGAERAYRNMVENTPKGFPGPHYELGWLYLGLGRTDEAEIEFQTCLEIDKTLAAPHYYLAQIALDRHQEKKAIEHFETYLRMGGRMYHDAVMQNLRALQPEMYR